MKGMLKFFSYILLRFMEEIIFPGTLYESQESGRIPDEGHESILYSNILQTVAIQSFSNSTFYLRLRVET